MTTLVPVCPSVKSIMSLIPWIFLDFTRAAMRSTTFSGPIVNGSSLMTIPILRDETFSTSTLARSLKDPLPVAYASRTPSRPTSSPPVGKSGPGIYFINCLTVAFGFSIKNLVAAITSPKLWGAIFVAIPTAIPEPPLTSRLGYAAGSTNGSDSCPS